MNERDLWILIKAKDLSEKVFKQNIDKWKELGAKGEEAVKKIDATLEGVVTKLDKMDEGLKSVNKRLGILHDVWDKTVSIAKSMYSIFTKLLLLWNVALFTFSRLKGKVVEMIAELKSGRSPMEMFSDFMKGVGDRAQTTGSILSGLKNVVVLLMKVIKPLLVVLAGLFMVGQVVKFFANLSNQMSEMTKTAAKLGISTEELIKKMYAIDVPIEVVDKLAEIGRSIQVLKQLWNAMWTSMKTKVVEVFMAVQSFAHKMAEISENVPDWLAGILPPVAFLKGFESLEKGSKWLKGKSDEVMTVEEISKMVDLRRQYMNLTMTSNELMMEELELWIETNREALKRDEILDQFQKVLDATQQRINENQLIAKNSLTSELLKLEHKYTEAVVLEAESRRIAIQRENPELLALYDELTRKQIEMEERKRWQIKETYDIWRKLQSDFISSTESVLTDTFVNIWQGKLDSAKDIFYNFLTSLQQALGEFLAQAIVQKFLLMMASGGSGTSAAFSGIGFGTYSGGASVSVKAAATGGWVGLGGPELVLAGEQEPELVVPSSKLNGLKGSSGGTTNVYYINAVDAASFADLVARNPDAIVSVVQSNVMSNKSLRRTIKDYT